MRLGRRTKRRVAPIPATASALAGVDPATTPKAKRRISGAAFGCPAHLNASSAPLGGAGHADNNPIRMRLSTPHAEESQHIPRKPILLACITLHGGVPVGR